jgi:hypothetical protein
VDEAGVRALLTPAGWELLESLPEYDESTSLALGELLRSLGNDPALVAAALTQSRLRRKARDKLGPFAAAMLFTADGLEQATRLSVAAHHARRYVDAGCERVADLGCGLGSDAMAFAGLDRSVLAVDSDELTGRARHRQPAALADRCRPLRRRHESRPVGRAGRRGRRVARPGPAGQP